MQRSQPLARNPRALNLQHLNHDQYLALLALNDSTITFESNQPCGPDFQMPNGIIGVRIDTDNIKPSDLALLQNIYINSAVKTDCGLQPGHHYLSIKMINSNPKNPQYQAVVICVTKFISVEIIQPLNQDESSRKMLYSVLAAQPGNEIFFKQQLYPAAINGSLALISLANDIIRYTSRKTGEARFAISSSTLGKGNQGVVYKSTHSLSFANPSMNIKQKADNKQRIIKISNSKKEFKVTSDIFRFEAEHECIMMRALPTLFHAKPTANDRQKNVCALISRYFPGQVLFDILFSKHPHNLNMLQRIELCLKIADNLQLIHVGGIIHRDLKVENIVVQLNADNDIIDAHIIDIGYAISMVDALQGGGHIPGSPMYAAPETWAGKKPTSASDIFTLGRVFWQILSKIHIDILLDTLDEAKAAYLPEVSVLFPNCNPRSLHPQFIQSLYYLLARMNDTNPENRIELATIIDNLKVILEMAKKHYADPPKNSNANTTTAPAASISLFGSTLTASAPAARSGSDPFYSSRPTI